MRPDLLPGFLIGASIGLITGLSVSPVAGTVVATLLSIVVGFVGLGGKAGSLTEIASTRVVGFCLGLAVAVPGAIMIRTHQWLAESPEASVRRWKEAGYTDEQARSLVTVERLGVTLTSPGDASPSPAGKTETKPAKTHVTPVPTVSVPPGANSGILFNYQETSPSPTVSQNYAQPDSAIAIIGKPPQIDYLEKK